MILVLERDKRANMKSTVSHRDTAPFLKRTLSQFDLPQSSDTKRACLLSKTGTEVCQVIRNPLTTEWIRSFPHSPPDNNLRFHTTQFVNLNSLPSIPQRMIDNVILRKADGGCRFSTRPCNGTVLEGKACWSKFILERGVWLKICGRIKY